MPASPRPPLCAGGDFLAPAGAHGFLGRRWKRPEFGERSAGGAVLPARPRGRGECERLVPPRVGSAPLACLVTEPRKCVLVIFIRTGLKVSCSLPATMMRARHLSHCPQPPRCRWRKQQPPRTPSPHLSHVPPARAAPRASAPAPPKPTLRHRAYEVSWGPALPTSADSHATWDALPQQFLRRGPRTTGPLGPFRVRSPPPPPPSTHRP